MVVTGLRGYYDENSRAMSTRVIVRLQGRYWWFRTMWMDITRLWIF